MTEHWTKVDILVGGGGGCAVSGSVPNPLQSSPPVECISTHAHNAWWQHTWPEQEQHSYLASCLRAAATPNLHRQFKHAWSELPAPCGRHGSARRWTTNPQTAQRNSCSLPAGEIRAAGGRGGESQAEGGEEEEEEETVQESEEGQYELSCSWVGATEIIWRTLWNSAVNSNIHLRLNTFEVSLTFLNCSSAVWALVPQQDKKKPRLFPYMCIKS